MDKLKRYTGLNNKHFRYCLSDDVAALEAKNAELEQQIDILCKDALIAADLEAKNAELVAEIVAYKEGMEKLWNAYKGFFDAYMNPIDKTS